MGYAVDIPRCLFDLMEELPRRTRAGIHLMLLRMAEVAPRWPSDDARWERFGRREEEGLCFYVEGCCVRIELRPIERLLRVREIGRVLVRLPLEDPGFLGNPVSSPHQH